jgi:hypothetical protein
MYITQEYNIGSYFILNCSHWFRQFRLCTWLVVWLDSCPMMMKWFVKVFYIFNYLVHLNQIRADIKTQTSKLRENSLALLKILCLFYAPFLSFWKGKSCQTYACKIVSCSFITFSSRSLVFPSFLLPLWALCWSDDIQSNM